MCVCVCRCFQAPQEYIDRNPQISTPNRRVFGGMVAALDEAVGNITAALQVRLAAACGRCPRLPVACTRVHEQAPAP